MDEHTQNMLMDIHERSIRIDERTETLVEKTKDQEKRLRALEKFKNWIAGILGLASATGVGTGINSQL